MVDLNVSITGAQGQVCVFSKSVYRCVSGLDTITVVDGETVVLVAYPFPPNVASSIQAGSQTFTELSGNVIVAVITPTTDIDVVATFAPS